MILIPRLLLINPWSRRMNIFLGRLLSPCRPPVFRQFRKVQSLVLTSSLKPLTRFIFMRFAGLRQGKFWFHVSVRQRRLPKTGSRSGSGQKTRR